MSTQAAMDICRWVRELPVSATAKSVAHAIGHRLGPSGEAWPSYRQLMADTSLGRRTVIRAVNVLVEAGVLVRDARTRSDGGRGSNIYSFGAQWDLFRTVSAGGRKKGGGGVTVTPGGGVTVAPRDATVTRAKGDERFLGKKTARRDSLEGNGNPDRCPDTADLEDALARQDAAISAALEAGYRGPLDGRSVSAFLAERGGVGAGA